MGRSTKTSWIFVAAAVLATSGCFLTDEESKSGGGPNRPVTEEPPPIPLTPTPGALGAPRLMRRLSIDLRQSLPSTAEIDALTADPEAVAPVLDALLAGADAPRSLAALHTRIWSRDASLPDLDAFIEDGDLALGSALTPARRRAIDDEPALLLRSILARRAPLTELFTADYVIASPANQAFWNLTNAGPAFSQEPYVIATYPDQRPGAGLLASPAFLARFGSENDPSSARRTRKILRAISCHKLDSVTAHLFYDLTAADFASGLKQLAATRAPCQGCHAQFTEPAKGFASLGRGTNYDDWLEYDPAGSQASGFYAGHPFTGLAELAAHVGNDPRTHRCAVESLVMALFQRPASLADSRTIAIALQRFYDNRLDLMAAIRELMMSKDYMYGVVGGEIPQAQARVASGVKLLRRQHWRGILLQLSPATAAIEIPERLDPGADETLGSKAFVPSGSYLRLADRVARQAASLIVRDEMADGAAAATRRVLTELPDGAAPASFAVVTAQLKSLWRLLTAEELADSSQALVDLQNLYLEIAPTNAAESQRAAWRTILVAVLTHPSFIVY